MSSIQRIDLWRSRQDREFMQGLNFASAAVLPSVVYGDTIELGIHNLERVTTNPAPTVFIETPWDFSQITAAAGLIDAPPTQGTFKLKVGDNLSTLLTWPAVANLVTAAQIAAWKLVVLNALKAISGVGGSAVVAADPTDAPANYLHFTWTDDADERVIELVENKLVPPCEVTVTSEEEAPAYTQLLKIVQLPIRMTDAFAFASAPAPTIDTDIPGASGTNEVQLITVPVGNSGAFALTRAGLTSNPINISGITAADIQTALNGMVPDGGTNPSFSVSFRSRGKYAVTFIGPLAGADQAELGVVALSEPDYTAVGRLVLQGGRFLRALNGQASVKLKLECRFTDADGSQTIIREFTMLAPMTGAGTLENAEEAGAVVIRDRTIYVTSDDLTPYFTVAPGVTFTPSVAGGPVVINHGKNTWQPKVTIHQKISADPETWEEVKQTIITSDATTLNSVTVYLPFDLSADTEDPLYFGNFKFFVSSPVDTIVGFLHRHSFLQVTSDGTADGQTLTAALGALAAQITSLGGGASISGGVIVDGSIGVVKIDMTAVVAAILLRSDFIAGLRLLVKDTDLITAIINELTTNTALGDTLKTLVTAIVNLIATDTTINTLFGTMLVTMFTNNSSLNQAFFNTLVSILQGGAASPDGIVLQNVPDFLPLDLPAVNTVMNGETILATVFSPLAVAFMTTTVGEVLGTFTADASTELITVSGPHGLAVGYIVRVNSTTTLPAGLAVATDYYVIASGLTSTTLKVSATLGGSAVNITDTGTGTHSILAVSVDGDLALTATTGARRIVFSTAEAEPMGGRESQYFPAGALIIFNGRFWQRSLLIGSAYYPWEYEEKILLVTVDADQLAALTQWLGIFTVQTQMLADPDPARFTTGLVKMVIEFGVRTVEGGGNLNIASLTWTTAAEIVLPLGPALNFHRMQLTVARSAEAVLGTCTANAGTELITVSAAHGLIVGDVVRFSSTTTPPAGLVAATDYYVIASGFTTTALKVSATPGGSAVNITDTGTGTHSILEAPRKAMLRKYLQTAATIVAPSDNDFAVRVRFTQFDVENVTDPAGSFHRACTGIRCSLASTAS